MSIQKDCKYNRKLKNYQYGQLLFTEFISSQKRKFINRFSFVGDPAFKMRQQKLFLTYLFQHGYAGVTSPLLLAPNDINQLIKPLLNQDQIEIINKRIVIGVAPLLFDYNDELEKGIGFSRLRATTRTITNLDVNQHNTALCRFGFDWETGFKRWLPWAQQYAEASIIARKKILISDGKLIFYNGDNTELQSIADQLYDVDTNVVTIKGETIQTFLDMNNQPTQNEVEKQFQQKGYKLELGSNEKVNDIYDLLPKIRKEAYYLNGERHNANFKVGDRNITDEFVHDNSHFKLLEKDMLNELEIFVEDYYDKFGIRLTIMNHIDIIEKEQAEAQGDENATTDNQETI